MRQEGSAWGAGLRWREGRGPLSHPQARRLSSKHSSAPLLCDWLGHFSSLCLSAWPPVVTPNNCSVTVLRLLSKCHNQGASARSFPSQPQGPESELKVSTGGQAPPETCGEDPSLPLLGSGGLWGILGTVACTRITPAPHLHVDASQIRLGTHYSSVTSSQLIASSEVIF